MGVLCDVYIADRNRFLKYNFRGDCDCVNWQSCRCWDEYSPATYNCILSRRVYVHDLAQLLSVLRGKKHRDCVVAEFKMIKEFSQDGPWIYKVPIALPRLLAAASTKQLLFINEAWAELANQTYRHKPVDDKLILDYLKLLRKLCKKSVDKKQSMYLWTCE
jgi:hypothetical protein